MAAMKNGGKFVIKPYQHNAQMNKEGAMDTWTSLDAAITQIHQQNASSLSFEELYRSLSPRGPSSLRRFGSPTRGQCQGCQGSATVAPEPTPPCPQESVQHGVV